MIGKKSKSTETIGRLVCFILSFSMLPLLAGCWDSIELNQRAVVAAIGIDRGSKHPYEVSFQVIVADEIAGAKARGGTPVVLYREEADTIFEAVRKAARKVARQVSLSHVRTVVISEELARKGIGRLLDFLERDAETRLTMQVFIARGHRAQDVLSTMTVVGRIPANDITGKQEMSERSYGETFVVRIDDVIRELTIKGGGPAIPGVRLSGDLKKAPKKENVEGIKPPAVLHIRGMGIFHGDRLVDWVDSREAIGLSILRNKIKSSVSTLQYGKMPEAVVIETVYSRCKIQASMDRGEPVFTVEVKQNGAAGEISYPLDLDSGPVMEEMQEKWSAETADYIERTVRAAKNARTDVLGFGEALERKYPREWKKLSGNWDKEFAESTVRIRVTSVVKHTQTRFNPYFKPSK